MALSGVSPSNPRPALRREYVFAAGPSTGVSPERQVLLIGNNTGAGTEADNLIDVPIVDDADARSRLGLRSEAYAMYRQFVAHPQNATIYVLCPAESAGAASSCSFKVTGVSDGSTTWEFAVHGETFQYSAITGDTAQTTSEGILAVANAHDSGRLQVVVTSLIDGAGPNYDTIFTAAQNGPRGNNITGQAATRGCRVRVYSGPGNAQAIAKTVGDYVAGGAADDHTLAIAEIAATGEFYYQVSAATSVVALVATDNGLGEHAAMITAQSLPVNGKDQRLFGGIVGTQAEATLASDGAATRSNPYVHLIHQENSDWTPAMLAAHVCGAVRQQEIAHPSANVNGWTSGGNRIFNVPVPFLKADYPTNAEIVADLNDGVCPISYTGGRVLLERFITAYHLNSTGGDDWRVREGHIPSAIQFSWAIFAQRYDSVRQPFADDDPTGKDPPTARTMVPQTIRSLLYDLIDDFVSSAPLGGDYAGPILKPSARQEMRDSVRVTYAGGGSFPTEVDFQAVEHPIKLEATIREVSDDY